ncbi:phage major capsid protein [Lysobacter sp. 5GHs7-4]|uniref:phage major capsid protein n=1 Tax=Lysobacter sp. 5GHs7-4 TaxID=2904253 RepID=UPI001E4A9F94|nr:phage major capsid protein [Lysobacter sp. 5GHs7-4]UHQ21898.1 phage major capsid protein [Lysobacter sp. 5GHs7-4]
MELKDQIKAELDKISDSVKEHAEKALAEAKSGRVMAESTKEQVDLLMTQQGEVRNRLQNLEQTVADTSRGGGEPTNELRAALDGGHESIQNFIKARNQSAQINIPVPRAALTNTGPTGNALNYPGQQILSAPLQPLLRRLTIRDLIAPGRTSKAVLFYQRETGFTNAAAPVSEGSLKPKSEITFELITEPVRTIAHLMDISLQMLDDVEFIQSYVETRMRYGLALVEEAQLLNGSGTGQNLEGIYTAATAYSQPAGSEVTAEQDLDKLRLALLQVELAEAFATGIVLHPTNWANIELLKDANFQYLFTNPQNTTTGRIWGRDVVSTQAMTLGRFLAGDFAMHAQIFDRQDANLAISFENKDNFERNMATLRVEERLALAIYRPEAFVKGTLESAS